MLEKVKLTILSLSTLIVAYALIGGVMERVTAGDEAYRDLSVFTRVIDHVQKDYVETPDMERTLRGALQGLMEALDPFSSFVDGETYARLADRKGSAGVGVVLSKRYGYAHIVAVSEGSPADAAGLRSGDLIESIEGSPTALMSLWEAERLLHGAKGTPVELRVIRSRRSQPQQLTLNRVEPGRAEPVARLMDEGIGLLRIPSFEEGVAQGVKAKVKMLQSRGMKALLIDLRSTAGGEFQEAVAVGSLFLEEGVEVAEIRPKTGSIQVLRSQGEPMVEGIPVALLIDGGTSGPAEVLAAALKDHGLAEIVGERSNGHGSIQGEFRLQEGGMLIISTALIVRPTGERLQSDEPRRSGLQPDLVTPSQGFVSGFYFDHTVELGEDEELSDDFYAQLDAAVKKEQLEAAIGHLKAKMSSGEQKIEKKAA